MNDSLLLTDRESSSSSIRFPAPAGGATWLVCAPSRRLRSSSNGGWTPRSSSPSGPACTRARASSRSSRRDAVRGVGRRRHRERGGIGAGRVRRVAGDRPERVRATDWRASLAIPLDPASAFQVAVAGDRRLIDAGELDGHLFFNIAGLGLDARVAHRFAEGGLERRGFVRYLELAAREIASFVPLEYAVTADWHDRRVRPLLIALANARHTATARSSHRRRGSTTASSSRGRRSPAGVEGAAAGAEAVFGTVAGSRRVDHAGQQCRDFCRRGARVSRRWRATCRRAIASRPPCIQGPCACSHVGRL